MTRGEEEAEGEKKIFVEMDSVVVPEVSVDSQFPVHIFAKTYEPRSNLT